MDIINLKNKIELDFEKIISNKLKCDDYLKEIEEIIEKINIKYNSLIDNIKGNKNIEIPIYLGIDSLNFQNKLFTIKYLNLKNIFKKLFNRIYGDYYKIYKLIKNYIISNTTIPIIDVSFTIYKDLDNSTLYNFQEICEIQNTIYQYIQSLYDIISKKNISIQPFINSNNIGYNVNYYIYEENTNINIYTNKCLLFINYLNTFNKYHNNYLLDFLLQCKFLIASINKEIDFNNENDLLNIDQYTNLSSSDSQESTLSDYRSSLNTIDENINIDCSENIIIQTNDLDNEINDTNNHQDIKLTKNISNESLASLDNNIENTPPYLENNKSFILRTFCNIL